MSRPSPASQDRKSPSQRLVSAEAIAKRSGGVRTLIFSIKRARILLCTCSREIGLIYTRFYIL